MEQFVEEGYSKAQLKQINRCRLYLQVTTLSDILDGYGNRFSNKAYERNYDDEIAHYYVWLTQPRRASRTRSV